MTTILEVLIKIGAALAMVATAFVQGDGYSIDHDGLVTHDNGTQECVFAAPCWVSDIEDPSIIGTVSDEWKALNAGETP